MAHRPYPDRDRALRQLHRHDPRRSLALTPPAWRELGESAPGTPGRSSCALPAQEEGSGRYVMSTR